ncbi:unnamed protein product [Bursaphelenchus okinawaensis]|uniref:Uncharacterized protein n=1 Tax=Bursaphelenchus okinawaensis TaxID=465554 RepID=A0A811LDD2_9BILA|nr:unnamed protein product [Bursaphelenchus okinawaensis]CAG9120604.1 unnamed protein product [Bursaphelenchus okinawaensis]
MSMDPIVQLSGKYKEELTTTFDGLRQRSTASIAAAQEQLKQQAEQLKQSSEKATALAGSLQDLSTVEIPTAKVLETFGWLTVTETAKFVFSFLASYMLSPLLAMCFDGFSAGLLAYIIVPAFLYRQLSGTEGEPDHHFYLLAGAAGEGLLLGYIVSERYLPAPQPLAFLTPMLIAVVTQLGADKFPSRAAWLGATLGAGVGAHIFLGLITGFSFAGFVLSLLYAALGFATLQLLIKDTASPAWKYQLMYTVGAILAHGLVFGIFGGEAFAPSEE